MIRYVAVEVDGNRRFTASRKDVTLAGIDALGGRWHVIRQSDWGVFTSEWHPDGEHADLGIIEAATTLDPGEAE